MEEQQQHILIKAIRQESLGSKESLWLREWLAGDEENARFLAEARDIWQDSGQLLSVPKRNQDAAWLRMKDRMAQEAETVESTPGRTFKAWRWPALAAAVLILAIIGFVLTRGNAAPQWELLATTGSTAERLALPDNSVLTLFPNSKIWAETGFGKSHRRLKLEGFAFFDISRNPQLPLSVEAADYKIQVLGTAFYWNAHDPQHPQLDVLEGTVAFFPIAAPEQGDTLVAFESASTTVGQAIRRLQGQQRLLLPPADLQPLAFEASPLTEVIEVLRTHYRQPIRLASADMGNCLFSGTFEAASLQEVLTAIQFTLGEDFQFEVQGQEIVILGSGCAK